MKKLRMYILSFFVFCNRQFPSGRKQFSSAVYRQKQRCCVTAIPSGRRILKRSTRISDPYQLVFAASQPEFLHVGKLTQAFSALHAFHQRRTNLFRQSIDHVHGSPVHRLQIR